MKHRHRPLLAACALIACTASHAATIDITTADGRGADATVRAGSFSNVNFSDPSFDYTSLGIGGNQEKFLSVERHNVTSSTREDFDSPFFRYAYLRFDIGAVTDPIVGGQLMIQVRGSDNGVAHGIALGAVRDVASTTSPQPGDGAPGSGGWTETGLTFDNRPVFYDTNGQGSAAPGDVLTFNFAHFSSLLADDSNGLVTFVLGGVSPDRGVNFFSHEYVESPLLTDTLVFDGNGNLRGNYAGGLMAPTLRLITASTAVAEPVTGALAMLGIWMVAASRFRRAY